MKTDPLPETLSPFATSHPASSAYRITMSPHEWEWTQPEQEAMAKAVVVLDAQRAQLRRALEDIGKVVDAWEAEGHALNVLADIRAIVQRKAVHETSPVHAPVNMRQVHHEPAHFAHWPMENCSECGTPTRYWLDPHTPLCKVCAASPKTEPPKN